MARRGRSPIAGRKVKLIKAPGKAYVTISAQNRGRMEETRPCARSVRILAQLAECLAAEELAELDAATMIDVA